MTVMLTVAPPVDLAPLVPPPALPVTGEQLEQLVGIAESWRCQLQAQGDLVVIPWPDDLAAGVRAQEVGRAVVVRQPGIVVLDGVHPHRLVPADGRIGWAPWTGGGTTLGLLCVPPDGAATFVHAEHDTLHVGAGFYAVRRQREWDGFKSLPVRD